MRVAGPPGKRGKRGKKGDTGEPGPAVSDEHIMPCRVSTWKRANANNYYRRNRERRPGRRSVSKRCEIDCDGLKEGYIGRTRSFRSG